MNYKKGKMITNIKLCAVFLVFSLFGCHTAHQTTAGTANTKAGDVFEMHYQTIKLLNELYFLVYESKELTKTWAYVYREEDAPDKLRLKKIQTLLLPELIAKIKGASKKWPRKEGKVAGEIIGLAGQLIKSEQDVMKQLDSYEDYEDVMVIFQVDAHFERGEGSITSITESILKKTKHLLSFKENELKTALLNL